MKFSTHTNSNYHSDGWVEWYGRCIKQNFLSNLKCASIRERYNHWFQREPAGWKGECLFNDCWMNVMLVWDLFPFSFVITLRIPISSVALRSDTSAARFELFSFRFRKQVKKKDISEKNYSWKIEVKNFNYSENGWEKWYQENWGKSHFGKKGDKKIESENFWMKIWSRQRDEKIWALVKKIDGSLSAMLPFHLCMLEGHSQLADRCLLFTLKSTAVCTDTAPPNFSSLSSKYRCRDKAVTSISKSFISFLSKYRLPLYKITSSWNLATHLKLLTTECHIYWILFCYLSNGGGTRLIVCRILVNFCAFHHSSCQYFNVKTTDRLQST